jgi:RNA 3'-terminal phosphate cyclase (ATP)
MHWIELDGSQGEGGGQILRTALTLSMLTGKACRLVNIRAKRAKPGLMRQHLTAVLAAAEICGAEVEGAVPGSQMLSFKPCRIKGGDYHYAIGTAGSCTLVLQTVLPALWFADAPSTVTVTGGTHNSSAPPADFLIHAWLPLVRRMGVDMDIELLRHGFYPAGGGEIHARITPVKAIQPLDLVERGALLGSKAISVIARLSAEIAKRELDRVAQQIPGIACEMRGLPSREGPGNVLLVMLQHEHCSEVFTAFGEKGVPSETVADRVAQEACRYLNSSAAVGEHLADQLVLPMALAGNSRLTTTEESSHLRTNLEVIGKFLPVTVRQKSTADAHWLEIGGA